MRIETSPKRIRQLQITYSGGVPSETRAEACTPVSWWISAASSPRRALLGWTGE